MILKNLWRRPLRSLLTLLGIAIGVAAVVSMGAIGQGMIRNYGKVIGTSNDLLVTQANAYDTILSILDQDLGQRIQGVPGVEAVEPGFYTYVATKDMPFLLIFGYEPGSVALSHYRLVEGKPLTGDKQIILGRRASDDMKKTLDDTVRVYGVPYRVVGIYETGQGMEESGGVVTLEDAQIIAGRSRKVSLFQVALRPNADADQVIERIERLGKELSVSKASEYDGSQQWSGMITGFAWGIASIAILIGGLGMMNAMVMSVLERTREIGTLRALGWTKRRVVTMILGEALVLSVIGGLLGLLLGVGLERLVASLPGVGAFFEGAMSPSIFLQGMVCAVILGLVGGVYPARSAANLQPVEALRYEGGGTGREVPTRGIMGWMARRGGQSLRNLIRRKNRTLLAATGVAVGVGTLVMLGSITRGMTNMLNQLAGSGGTGNITLMQRDTADMSLSNLDETMVAQIRALPGVKAVSSMLMGFITTQEMPFFIVQGIDPNSKAMEHYKVAEGRTVQRPNEVMLGKTASSIYKLPVGSTMTVLNNRYRVVGIYETGVAWEEGGGLLALREAQRILERPRAVSFIFVDTVRPAEAEALVGTLNTRFPDARASMSSQFAQNTQDIQMTVAMGNSIGLLAMLIGGVVVANTMIMTIYERTREIGTLRALGWRKQRILTQVVQEGLLLCLLAGFMGIVVGLGFIGLIMAIPGANTMIGAAFDPPSIVTAMVVALVVGLVGSLYPAWRASKLQPVEALRYE